MRCSCTEFPAWGMGSSKALLHILQIQQGLQTWVLGHCPRPSSLCWLQQKSCRSKSKSSVLDTALLQPQWGRNPQPAPLICVIWQGTWQTDLYKWGAEKERYSEMTTRTIHPQEQSAHNASLRSVPWDQCPAPAAWQHVAVTAAGWQDTLMHTPAVRHTSPWRWQRHLPFLNVWCQHLAFSSPGNKGVGNSLCQRQFNS